MISYEMVTSVGCSCTEVPPDELGMCVCDVVEFVKLSQPTVSHHLAILERAGLVQSKKIGRWVYYQRNEPFIKQVCKQLQTTLTMLSNKEIKQAVQEHYGQLAQQGRSCCGDAGHLELIGYSQEELAKLSDEVLSVGAGCGNPIALAELREGEIVLDLGSGGGIDVLLAAQKVGPRGRAIGVDMTEAMVERARASAKKLGFTNVEFLLGEIESLPVADASVDVVISNCVINLVPDKAKAFSEAFRVLKPGGRLIVSDIVTHGKLANFFKGDLTAWANCLAGAIEDKEYLKIISETGFEHVEIIAHSPIPKPAGFYSVTVRAFKPAGL
ncbi:MAG: arsenite methyltransferase [Candidatus Bipolaricaulota bacterium]|nr:arsenite methyltransferase [Candidatus Bipolaricaulota bacterium]